MYKAPLSSDNQLRRRGQALAEFALTLPLLLLLIFGVVEFGRIFQAWVTIENSARESIRYTTTGTYDKERYNVDAMLPCTGDADERGIREQVSFGGAGPVEIWYKSLDIVTGAYEITGDSIFATWYEGILCDIGTPEHLEWREDILRLASIYDTARRGAAGLSLERSQQNRTTQALFNMMTALWSEPMPRSNQRGYFNVMVCSSRTFLDRESYGFFENINTRFVTVPDEESVPTGFLGSYSPPYCLLNEYSDDHKARETFNGGGVITINNSQTDPNHNLARRWMDPGGPGDLVTIFITFNHPLITPLGLAEYITMTAHRSGVNEAFRASKALVAPSSNPPTQIADLNTPIPTPIPDPTDTPIPSDTPTFTPTVTPTETPEPFTCDKIRVGAISFYNNTRRVYVQIINDNPQDTSLQQVKLRWPTPAGYPNMYLFAMILGRTTADSSDGGGTLWEGNKQGGEIDSAGFIGTELADWTNADKSIPGFGKATTTFEAMFLVGPASLSEVFTPADFAGTEFYIYNPVNPALPCIARVQDLLDEVTPPPPPGPTSTPSITFTPDCASSRLRVEFVDFWTLGVIQLRVTSERNVSSLLLGFNIQWYTHPTLTRVSGPNIFSLARVKVGGSNPNAGDAITAWTGPDFSPSTRHTEGSGLTQGIVFGPNSVTNLWLDFDGYGNRLDDAVQFASWMLHGSQFDIDCNTTGGNGGQGGGGLQGVIDLSVPTPPPSTNTPRPTNTPGPTNTPSPTRPTNTPSRTPTPGPTRTSTLTPTATMFTIPTITPIPTQDGGTGSG